MRSRHRPAARSSRCIPEKQKITCLMYAYVAENRRNTWCIGVRHIKYGIGKYDQHAADDVPAWWPLDFWVRKREYHRRARRRKTIRQIFVCMLRCRSIFFIPFRLKWEQSMLLSFLEILLMSVGYNLISIGVSYASYRKIHGSRKSPLRYGTIVSNGGFSGKSCHRGNLWITKACFMHRFLCCR